MRNLYVYVAGPLTQGWYVTNLKNAVNAATELMENGFLPFIPHILFAWELVNPQGYEYWMNYDLGWLARCDILLRLPGHSPGADREEVFAKERGIPVYYSIAELLEAHHVG